MIRKLGTGVLVVLTLLILVEGVAWVALWVGSKPAEGFLVSRGADFHRQLARGFVGTSRGQLAVDPHLGYALEPAFEVFGVKEKVGALRIVALGGSTTDPHNEGHWPGVLSELLERGGISAKVFNGGVGSYSTNQEVVKLIRDALSLSPDLVVSVDGVNDLGLVKSISAATPMVNNPQEMIARYVVEGSLESVFLPNLVRLFGFGRGILREPHWGRPAKMAAEEVWEKNVRLMNAISAEFGARYLCVLQPIMGFGSYNRSSDEEEMWKESKDRPVASGLPYHEALKGYYQAAQARCGKLPYCADLTEIFAGQTNLYNDPRHPNPDGYRLLAEAVFRELRDRGLLAQPEAEESASTAGAGE